MIASRLITLGIMAAVLLVVGCNGGKVATSGKAPLMVVESSKPTAPATKSGGAAPAAPAVQAARDTADTFLKALLGGEVAGARDRVAIAFRKELSGPLTFAEEKRLGYSDSDTERYLRSTVNGAQRAEIRSQVVAPSGQAVIVRGELSGGPQPRQFCLRLAKETDNWQVTYFAAVSVATMGLPNDGASVELNWARQWAVDFLAALVGGGDEQARSMHALSEPFKESLPAPSIADSGLKYARKDVRNWLNMVRGESTGFTVTREEMPGAGAVFLGQLTGGKKPVPFRLELAREGDQWKINKFDVTP